MKRLVAPLLAALWFLTAGVLLYVASPEAQPRHVIPSSTFAGLPAAGSIGSVANVTDSNPGIYLDSGSAHILVASSTGNPVFLSSTSFAGTLDHSNTASRTWTLQDSTDTLVGRATTDTLTSKTLNLTSNTLTGTAAQFDAALSDSNFLTTVSDITKTFGRDVSVTTVANTVVETVVSTFSVPGLTLVGGDALRIRLYGFYLNNSGANSDFTIRVKVGGIARTTSTFTVPTNASQRAIGFDCIINAVGSANADLEYKGYVGAPGTDTGSTTQVEPTVLHAGNFAFAVDWLSAQTLDITFQHSVANANISATQRATHVEELE